MDFQSVNGKELSFDLNLNSPEKEENIDPNIEQSNIENVQKTPNNPVYWQNSVGIKNKVSFKGNKHNSNIEDKTKELIERGVPEEYAKLLAESCIDPQSGLFSPISDDLIDFFYPVQMEKGIKGKFSYFKNNLKNKIVTRSKVEIFIDCNPVSIMDSVKDGNGNFNETNLDYLYKVIKMIRDNCSYCSLSFLDIKQIIDMIKDKDGVVSPAKFKRFESMYKKNSEDEIEKVLNSLDSFPEDKQDVIFSTCMNFFENEGVGIANFSAFSHYCFDENGNRIPENIEFAKNLTHLNENLVFEKEFFDLCRKYPELKSFIIEIIENIEYQDSLDIMVSFINSQIETEGALSDLAKQKMIAYSSSGNDLDGFSYVFDFCSNDKSRGKEGFDSEMFEKVIQLRKIINDLDATDSHKRGKDYIGIINGDIKPNEINFKNKVNLLKDLEKINSYIVHNNIDGFQNIDSVIAAIDSSLKLEDISLPIKEESRVEFDKRILYSNSNYTKFENVIISSIPMLEKMVQGEGLPLLYSRADFLEALSSICQSDEDKAILTQKVGITPIIEDNGVDKQITGYDGLIQLDNLDLSNPKEKQIYTLLHKFIYENNVITGNKEFDEQLNTIINAFPEFINIIGKKQHGTHNYTLDVHSLLVLAYSINNPNYLSKLNSLDRSLLKVTSLFHDIMKNENVVDKGHQNLSSLYTRSILSKIFTSSEILDRVFGLIDNHHWLQEYSQSNKKENTAQELAFRFRRPNDFDIAKIMAESDLKAVSSSFYDLHKSMLSDEKLGLINKNINYIYSNGNAIFSDYIIKPSCLDNCIVNKNGKEFRLINMHEIPEGTDMGQYGFMKGLKKENLTFLVHMVDENSIYNSLSTVKLLTSPFNGGVLSESIITPKYKRTYQNRKYGVLLSQENVNLVNEANSNQGSGIQKDFSNVMSLIFDDCSSQKRNNFRIELLKNLGIPYSDVSDEEYAEFFKNVLAYRTSLAQIRPNEKYKIGNFIITGEQLSSALYDYQMSLINVNEKIHNEIVGYLPKIQAVVAKAQNIDELPDELLKFANENNYPILLI